MADAARKEEARREQARREEARREGERLTALARMAAATPPPEAPRTRSIDTAPNDGAAGTGTYAVASAASEPIRPIHVKTLKVKMAPAHVAALAPAVGTLMPTAATTEPKREPERDLIAEAIHATVHPETAPQPPAPIPPVVRSGWIIQVGAFDVEQEARARLSAVQAKAGQMLKHASPFTEAVTAGEKTFYRARFAGVQKDQAEAVCRQLKRNDIACMTIKN
jgi:D-alanyl-D-alanine carboxypeptidase